MPDKPGYRTAPCSVCGRHMRVKTNGTIGHHGSPSRRCKGVGKPPVANPLPIEERPTG